MDIRVGDYGYAINFSVKQSDESTAEDLTDIEEIKFLVRPVDSQINIVDGTCVVVLAASGTCKYTVGLTDFAEEGNFIGALRLTYSGTKRVTSREFSISVKKTLKA